MDLSGVSRRGVVVPVPGDRAGITGPTRWQARGAEWRRSSRGLFVPTYVDGDAAPQRIVESAAVPPGPGWTSLHWQGGRWFEGLARDLIDPEAGVVGEYDGLVHLEDGRRSRDLNREEMIGDLRLQLVTMVSADAADIDSFVRRPSAAYRRGRATRPSGAWTTTPPTWWIDTSTVAARRALTESERQLLLRRQRAA